MPIRGTRLAATGRPMFEQPPQCSAEPFDAERDAACPAAQTSGQHKIAVINKMEMPRLIRELYRIVAAPTNRAFLAKTRH